MAKLTLNPETNTVFSRAQLREVFDMVSPSNWRTVIDTEVDFPTNVIHPVFEEMISDAVIFFTGSIPTITPNGKGGVRVQAVGYYRAIGA